ncbi:hypothetical protein LLG90_19970 [Aromatoleum toluclasticum]|uniref:hypothetical protein n=1 Tax=Aromatoleum toluclasticum TaxID=92003 RepID=UPI001D193D0C|nr:hypothetical protein [Aromatoleum toluclasticum]MCC4117641.1 hypothetical protein [Aromatoleum toluclasticum]
MSVIPEGMMVAGSGMSPNPRLAQSFLTALDEDSDAWSFQTFDDSKAGEKRLTRLFHGSLDRYADDLATLNEQGAGVFVTVNETDGKGRTKANIRRIRALYVRTPRAGSRIACKPAYRG